MPEYSLAGKSPLLHDSSLSWIAPSASVIGAVEIFPYVSVWFGAVLRGDNELITLETSSNIQDNCVLHTDITFPLKVGSDCTIGHGTILHGCSIGSNSLVGMGSTILNGAKIGKDCLIGAGTLVLENQVIPDGSLAIGSPAKIIRVLTAHEKVRNTKSAQSYKNQMNRYRKFLNISPKVI